MYPELPRRSLIRYHRNFKRYTSKQILQEAQSEWESCKKWMLFQFKYAAKQHIRNKQYQYGHTKIAQSKSVHLLKALAKSKMDYIHNNPVRAGWVEIPENYVYSSAKDYYTGKRFGAANNVAKAVSVIKAR